jgi:hypothetical protein
MAVDGVAQVMGVDARPQLASPDSANVTVFASPHNGAPVVIDRILEFPGLTVHEMNLYDTAGTVVDTQVLAVRPLAQQ